MKNYSLNLTVSDNADAIDTMIAFRNACHALDNRHSSELAKLEVDSEITLVLPPSISWYASANVTRSE